MSTEEITKKVSEVSIKEDQSTDVRLYFGNVDYSVTKEDLSEFLKNFKPTNFIIPTRTHIGRTGYPFTRPIGIAFADFKTKEEADKVIQDLSGGELKGRVVSISPAIPYDAAKKQKQREEFQARQQQQHHQQPNNYGRPPPAQFVHQQHRGKPEDGTPSKTTVFVNNLDYNLSREELLQVFAEFKPVWAYVPRRKVPAFVFRRLKETGQQPKGRGFGFVRFENEEVQKKVIEEFNGKTVSNRPIVVTVAIDSQINEHEQREEAASGAEKTKAVETSEVTKATESPSTPTESK